MFKNVKVMQSYKYAFHPSEANIQVGPDTYRTILRRRKQTEK
jgi:hypothetical protein